MIEALKQAIQSQGKNVEIRQSLTCKVIEQTSINQFAKFYVDFNNAMNMHMQSGTAVNSQSMYEFKQSSSVSVSNQSLTQSNNNPNQPQAHAQGQEVVHRHELPINTVNQEPELQQIVSNSHQQPEPQLSVNNRPTGSSVQNITPNSATKKRATKLNSKEQKKKLELQVSNTSSNLII